jgi:hypothetical protein
MTAGIVIRCDGTPADRPGMSLERCRAFLPTRAWTPLDARALYGQPAGWTSRLVGHDHLRRREDLCPACSPSPQATQ